MPIKTIRRIAQQSYTSVQQVREPFEKRILQQHIIVRYSVGGLSVLIGIIGLATPILPGVFLIIAGVSIINKSKNIVKVHIKTVAIIIREKTKEKLHLFSLNNYNKNLITDKFTKISNHFSYNLQQILSEAHVIDNKTHTDK